ncbi:MAG: acetyl-CoA carboxylase, carboxyltransferase subunit beta, partial [Rhodospirillales bacterium]
YVCPHCGYHMRINARQRLTMLFDDGKFEEIKIKAAVVDPLKFRDQRKYAERLKQAQNKSENTDALAVASGRLGGIQSVIAALDFEFMGGSMGTTVGDGILEAARLAVGKKAPLIVVSSSGGARMQEGILSLMQLARTTLAVEDVKSAGLPYIVVLADPTTGGVTASFAMLGDIAIAEQGAAIGFAGARVIEQTIRETLPEGFQRAEYLLEHGMVDMVVHRRDLRDTLVRVLDLLLHREPAGAQTHPQLTPPQAD